jgi:protein O-mannosyl-transferase
VSDTAARRGHARPRAGITGVPPPRTAARAVRPLLLSCALVTVIVLAYHNSLSVPFIFDDESIVEEFAERGLSTADVVIGSTRPLVQLSFAANYAAGNLDVRGYHLVNIAVHALAAVVLFAIVRRSLAAGAAGSPWLAFVIALAWAVHPLQTESVTYVSQRAESLAGLFALTTLYCVIRGATAARGTFWYAAGVLACLLGMASKPVMVATPILVLLYDRAFLTRSWRLARPRRLLYGCLAATWTVLAVLLAQPHESASTAGFAMPDLTPFVYTRTEPGVILHYLRLVVWPTPLVLDYGWPAADDPVTIVLSSLAIAGLVAVAVWTFRRRPAVGFLGIAFFLLLAPSSSVIPIRDLAAEHRMYLPLAPLVALIVLAAARLLHAIVPASGTRRGLSTVLVGASVACLIVLTVRRNAQYGSPIEMWRDITAYRPTNARAHNNLARLLIEDGRIAEASPHAARAVALSPTYAHARNNLGVVLRKQGRTEDAIREFDEALRLDPGYADAYNNRGLAWADSRRFDEAVADYEHALRLRPRSADVHGNLGTAMLVQGKVPEAIREYDIALRLQPNRAEMHYNMALALSAQGESEGARIHYAEALRLNPALAGRIAAGEAGATERRGAPLR